MKRIIKIFQNRFDSWKEELIRNEVQRISRIESEKMYKNKIQNLEDKILREIHEVIFDHKNLKFLNFYDSLQAKKYGERRDIELTPTARENDDINKIITEQTRRINDIFKSL